MNKDSNRCKTKYPVVLVHGAGFRDRKLINYWGRIPKALEQNGAEVFYCYQDAWGAIETNAEIIKQSILKIVSDGKYDKVNIIAHSKGGLDARYAVNALGIDKYIASFTTISTPHHGSKTIDFIYKFPKPLIKLTSKLVDGYFKLLGDRSPDFYKSCEQFTTKYCKQFYQEYDNLNSIYYQSYASKMKNCLSDIFLTVPYLIVKIFDGDNDGVVGVESAKGTNFMGVIENSRLRGVSHADIVDARRMDINDMDIRKIYIDIIYKLKQKGF